MNRLHIVCWKWRHLTYRTKFTAEHVNILGAMLERHHRQPFRFLCVTDDARGIEHETFPLWSDCGNAANPSGPHFPSCYRRLKLFSPEQQASMEIAPGDRVVSIDLDVVIADDVVPMFDRPENFVGWKGVGTHHPTVYNGTIFLFRAGTMQHLWNDFDPVTSPTLTRAAKFFGSDQAWLSYKLRGSAPGWDKDVGMYSYSRDIAMLSSDHLPKNARIVSFNGKRKPWEPRVQDEAPWIKAHWRM